MSSPRTTHAVPVTARGVRTRDRLVAAARVVFERAGYLDARLVDISKEAGLSTGSFYTYFANKEEVFAAVVEVTQNDLLHPGMGRVADEGDVHAVVEASIRAYLHAWRRNARLLALLEQVAHVDPNFRELARQRDEAFFGRNARSIADLQARGLADASLDPMLTSKALSAMVGRVAYGYFVGPLSERESATVNQLTAGLARMWTNALRIPDRARGR
ncbi:TetR/AcrR family transcriptional regulator [Rhodococcus marinonascens]|uniref:TetR/AcrR family transcriptional regulator n=1 Tax=Rhodococcus marinonascens TaxID=38311 RepID=UPI0009345E13|nr:TetR/AcrR family transcriptional regulator [Rhodococcus marinonascens]